MTINDPFEIAFSAITNKIPIQARTGSSNLKGTFLLSHMHSVFPHKVVSLANSN
ncbi:hypothetical protein BN1013_01414 [Candidatus Rubidus massiliensis]|nr:hypothetical protein BN1013_01414 [Candidatus Rubidus massiliensis]